MLDVPAEDLPYYPSLLVDRYAFTSNAVHDAERRPEVCVPRGSKLPERLPELAFGCSGGVSDFFLSYRRWRRSPGIREYRQEDESYMPHIRGCITVSLLI